MASSLVMGVDVGCSTCSVAVLKQGSIDQVANEQGSRTTPACIAFTDVETLIGEPARGELVRNAANTIVDGLRLLGREHDSDTFQSEMQTKGWRYRISKGKDSSVQVDVTVKGEAKSFAAPRLTSMLLARLRADAEASSGEAIKEAVIAVPAHFDARQRAALKEAAQIGGMRVKLVLSSPLCVALLYGQTAGAGPIPVTGSQAAAGLAVPPPPQQLLVVDVGGSEVVASIVERVQLTPVTSDAAAAAATDAGGTDATVARTARDEYTVRASVHERGAGANDVDSRLRAHVLKEIRRRQRVDLTDNGRAMARLLAACQVAKHSLTASSQATITVEADGVDYFSNVSRAALEELSTPLATQAASLASRALATAGLAPLGVHALLLSAGGGAHIHMQSTPMDTYTHVYIYTYIYIYIYRCARSAPLGRRRAHAEGAGGADGALPSSCRPLCGSGRGVGLAWCGLCRRSAPPSLPQRHAGRAAGRLGNTCALATCLGHRYRRGRPTDARRGARRRAAHTHRALCGARERRPPAPQTRRAAATCCHWCRWRGRCTQRASQHGASSVVPDAHGRDPRAPRRAERPGCTRAPVERRQ